MFYKVSADPLSWQDSINLFWGQGSTSCRYAMFLVGKKLNAMQPYAWGGNVLCIPSFHLQSQTQPVSV